jgi:hypothetical protein
VTTPIHPIIIVLGLKPANVPALLARSTAIVTAMTANKGTYPTPPLPFATVTADIATLSAAQTALKNRAGTMAARDDARKALVAGIHQLRAYVQQLADANPTQAAVIAENAAMTLRKSTAPHKSDLATKQVISGTVHVIAKAIKGARSYEWQFSTDGGKTWASVAPTTKATTSVPNLTPGVLTTFRHRAVTKGGPSEWGQPVSAMVS